MALQQGALPLSGGPSQVVVSVGTKKFFGAESASAHHVTPGCFNTVGTDVLKGRDFHHGDP